jgi:hypothetical protein
MKFLTLSEGPFSGGGVLIGVESLDWRRGVDLGLIQQSRQFGALTSSRSDMLTSANIRRFGGATTTPQPKKKAGEDERSKKKGDNNAVDDDEILLQPKGGGGGSSSAAEGDADSMIANLVGTFKGWVFDY